ncbi:MAG: glycoside hydrolase family 1 protein [Metamycoplasmataceae bacterium]
MEKFNKKFLFSASTCSYQIEGGRLEGGRTYSNWDKFTIENFYIPPKDSNEREINSIEKAANFYEKYDLDAKIMKEMGLNSFVYNLDWARIFPDESGKVNLKGIKFYENVFNSLIENGIKPIPVLYHWDTPLWLEKLGGSSSPIFLEAYRNFAKTIFKYLGKYSDIWYVSDENSSYTVQGYLSNYIPPEKNNEKDFWKAIYYLSISGAIAKEEFEHAKQNNYIKSESILGIDHDWCPPIPYDKKDIDDIMACLEFNEYNLNLFLDPNILGKFPECFWNAIKKFNLEEIILQEDLETLAKNTLDLIGWNYYRPAIIAHPKRLEENIDWKIEPTNFITKKAIIVFPKDKNYTAWNWLIMPEYLSMGGEILWKKYQKPLMILENGIGYFDKKENGIVNDEYRINFLNEHLKQVQIAIENGVNFIGYSAWTYCDIFSPSGGYRKKYGFVGVDFDDPDLKRFPKSSMFWYKDVINKLTTFDSIDYKKYQKEAQESLVKNIELWNK